jgi:hypothetical protein
MVAGTRLYFGEYTFYPGGGHDPGLDQALAERAEELWDLFASDFLRKRHRGLVRLYTRALRAAIEEKSDRGHRHCECDSIIPALEADRRKGRLDFRPPRPRS